MESKKRKREQDSVEDAIITFYAPGGRTFSRVFKDKTLAATKETVRKKLDLAPEVKLQFVQLRDGKKIDLDDDDDFLAFRAFARTDTTLDVQVNVLNSPANTSTVRSVSPSREELQNFVRQYASVPLSSLAHKSNAVDRGVGTSASPEKAPSRVSGIQPKVKPAAKVDTTNSSDKPPPRVSGVQPKVKPAAKVGTTETSDNASLRVSGIQPKVKPAAKVGTTDSSEKAPSRVSGVQPKIKKKSKKSSSPTGVESAEPSVAPALPKSSASLPLSSSTRPAESELDKDDGPRLKKRKTSHKTSQEDSQTPVASSSKVPVAEQPASQEVSPQKKVQWSADVPNESVGVKEKVKSAKKTKKTTSTTAPEADEGPIRKKKKKTLDNAQDDGTSLKEKKSKTNSDASAPSQDVHKEGPPKDKIQPSSSGIKPKKKAKDIPATDPSSSQKVPDTQEKGKSKATTASKEPRPRPSRAELDPTNFVGRLAAALIEYNKNAGKQVVKTPATTSAETASSSALHKPPLPEANAQIAPQPSSSEKPPSAPSDPPATSSVTKKGAKNSGVPDLPNGTDEHEPASIATAPAAEPSTSPQRGKRARTTTVVCPVCLSEPFHLKFMCPVVTAGPDSIKRRIAELEKDPSKQQLQAELKHLLTRLELQDAARKQSSGPPMEPAEKRPSLPENDSDIGNGSMFATRSPSPEVPHPAVLPTIPSGSEISEVIVQGKDSDSDDESSEDEPLLPAKKSVRKVFKPASRLSSFALPVSIPANPTEEDIEALLHGPASMKPDRILDRIFAKGDDGSESEGDDLEAMASEEEEKNDRAFRRLSQQIQRRAPSSDEEDDEDEELGIQDKEVPMDVDDNAEVPPSELVDDVAETSSAKAVSEALAGPLSTGTSASRDDAMDVDPVVTNPGHNEQKTSPPPPKLRKPKEVVPSSEDEEDAPRPSAAQPSGSAPVDPESSPDVPIVAHQDDDPIEPSEEPESRADVDPIEPAASQTPSTPLPKSATAKKMKDRTGKTSDAKDHPFTAATVASIMQKVTHPSPGAASEQPTVSAGMDAEPTPTPSATQSAPKRRGRPPLSAEVKAERARIAAEKKAEKEAEKKEKARQKSSAKVTKSKKSVANGTAEHDEAADDPSTTVPEEPASTQKATAATSGWETLSVTPSAPDVAMVDELRSSSPDHAGNDTTAKGPRSSIPASSSQPTGDDDMQDELATPMAKTAGITSATPLFLASAQRSFKRSAQSQPNGNSSPLTMRGSASQMGSQIKSAVRPVSSWKIPRLSDIASQAIFSPLSAHPVPPRPSTSTQKKLPDAFKADDSSSSSSSDSDEEPISHIPKGRRAGAQKK